MNTQILFKEVCPQQFVGNIDHVLSSTIVTGLDQVRVDHNKPYIIVAKSQLQTFINHLVEYEAPVKNLLIEADNAYVALMGLENRIRTQYQEMIIDARVSKINQFELRKAKLKIAPKKELKRLALSVLYYMLRSYPLTSIESAVATVCEVNNNVTKRWATSKAKRIVDDMEKQFLTAKTLTVPHGVLQNPDELTLNDYMKEETFLNYSSTGTGKTQLNEKLVSHYINQGLTVAYISHRITISRGSLVNEPNTAHYLEVKYGTEHSIKCLNIVVNSITKARFESFIKNVDVVILEEGKQVFEHLVIGTVNNRTEVYEALIKLCQQAKTLIVSDADLDDCTLDLIKRARPHQHINYLYKSMDFSQKSIDISGYDNVLAEIENTVGTEPVIICSDSKKQVDDLAEDYRKKGLRVLTITKDDAQCKEQKLFCKLPDDVLHKYDVILYSPTITSSTSITKGRFVKHFGLFNGTVCSSTIIQMLRRNRPCMQFIVGIKPPNKIKETRLDELLCDDANDFEVFSAKVVQHINFDTNNIVPALYFNAKSHGFNVSFNECTSVLFKPKKAELKAFEHKLNDELLYQGITEAANNRGKELTNVEDYYFADVRSRMEETLYKAEITAQDAKFWFKNKFEQKLSNFTKLMEGDVLFKQIFEVIGIDVYTGEGQVTKLDAVKLYKVLLNRKVELDQKMKGMILSDNLKDPTQAINNVIRTFGFIVNRSQVGSTNKKVRVSRLCSESVAYMHDCWDRRKFKQAA